MSNKAHEKDPNALRFEPHTWYAPTEARPFRRCSFCASIHPADLLALLKAGETLQQADWAHGWPHKFYTSEYVKFYSVHMIDAGDDFIELAGHIAKSGILFEKAPEGINYKVLHRTCG